MSTAYYERLCGEDIDTGKATTTKRNPGGGTLVGTQVGLHTFARNGGATQAAWTPGSIAAGSYASTTLTVAGATFGDMVMASFTGMLTSPLTISAHVSAASTVTVVISNNSGSLVTLSAGTVSALVFDFRVNTSPVGGGGPV